MFSAKWCPSCSRLHKQVLAAPEGARLLEGIPLEMVDFDKAPDRVAKHSVTGLPTTVFLDGRGRELDRIEGFDGPGEYLAQARAILGGRDMLSLLEDGLRRRPDSLELRYKIGRKLLGRGREKEAMAHYDKVLAADPKNRTGLVGKILVHRARYLVRVKRDPGAAVAYLKAAVKRVPGGRAGESLRFWLAHALCLSGRPAAAVEVVDEQVRLRGRKAAALILAAGLRRKCRGGYELQRALGQVREALAKAPANDWAWYLLAAISGKLGRKAEARRAIARALELAPGSPFYEGEARRIGLGR